MELWQAWSDSPANSVVTCDSSASFPVDSSRYSFRYAEAKSIIFRFCILQGRRGFLRLRGTVNTSLPASNGGIMYHYYWAGMEAYWWLFWIIMIIVWIGFLFFMTPVRRSRWVEYSRLQTPLQILQRRYAAGEITHEEYEERKARLQRDANLK
ncbi:MAG: SHOCT domain-containing protein [Acidobacteriaceae bacterium]